MSLKISDIPNIIITRLFQGNRADKTTTGTEEVKSKNIDTDSYVSTIAEMQNPAPCENYNYLRSLALSSEKSEAGVSNISKAGGITIAIENFNTEPTASGEVSSSESAGGSGSSSDDSSSSETTETSIVYRNGEAYLQKITTDASGNETVTYTKL